MNTTTPKNPAQNSGLLYTLVGVLGLLLAFVAVTVFLRTREAR